MVFNKGSNLLMTPQHDLEPEGPWQQHCLTYSSLMWEFPKIRDSLFWGLYNQDPTISGATLGSPTFRNSHVTMSKATATQHCLYVKVRGT